MRRTFEVFALIALSVVSGFAEKSDKKRDKEAMSALDEYVQQAHRAAETAPVESPGSLWSGAAMLVDISSDLRARHVNDMVTILVNEIASAVSTGATKTGRSSDLTASVGSAAGKLSVPARFSNILTTSSKTNLDGSGTTSRTTTLTTTITARVVDVLPNGFLVVEGNKTVLVNSENQVVTLRGVVRPTDLTTANTVQSGSVGQMELKINGKGVVNDAVRRPNFLYRLLLGVLPF
ncbi:MAG: flagellar basal body L-ring protein FlgH [Bryobacteraceae bacterium]